MTKESQKHIAHMWPEINVLSLLLSDHDIENSSLILIDNEDCVNL